MTDHASPSAIASSIAGREVGPLHAAVDARWLMAYAAGLGETDARYYDTAARDGPLAHPLFAVCYEWPAALAIRARTIAPDLAPLGVHVSHDLTIHRPPRAGDVLSTTARVTTIERRRSGTLVVVRFLTVDSEGVPVTVTDHGTLYRGVDADDRAEPNAARIRPPTAPTWIDTLTLSPSVAHVYTECARIWNPIHTDVAVARAAGLPGLILHGTATLALAVSRVVARDVDGDPTVVRRVTARFTGMVTLPSHVLVRGRGVAGETIGFDAVTGEDRPVLLGETTVGRS